MLSIKNRVKKASILALTATVSLASFTGMVPMNASAATTSPYQTRFETMYDNIKNPANGYFSTEGIPYHSVETFMSEAPDYGHETTSEAFSYYVWIEAMKGKFSGDFSGYKKAWDITEKLIPSHADQPAMAKYDPSKPATYAGEWELPSMYPSKLDSGAPVGKDPIDAELKSAYSSSDMYGMHWIMDVDNWYGFGQRGDGTTRAVFMNTFQRGVQESVFETVPQPCWDALKFGGKNGYLDLFTQDATYAAQYKYTNAPDADARSIQASYYANKWAKEYGVDVSATVAKAAKMGDYLRYSFYDKYFRKIGSPTVAGTGADSSTGLLTWYYAWGGDASSQASWAWKIGSSHMHFGYQNPFAAWVLSTDASFKPKSSNGATDWAASLTKQLEFYTWLQSSEGAIAGGASNSNNGRYEAWPAGTATFYGMGYQENPVYADPGSNTWFGMQAWSMQRVAQYYYETKDVKAKTVLDKWAKWINSEISFGDGTFSIPSSIDWDGQPDTWTGTASANSNLHVKVVSTGSDLGTASSLANALTYYAAASGDTVSMNNAKGLLDCIWNNNKDSKGVSATEARGDYHRMFDQVVSIPLGWTGKMPNGDTIQPGVKFIEIRSQYKNDPDYARVKAAVDAGESPTFNYHRFWAQSDFALANGTFAMLFPNEIPGGDLLVGDINGDKVVNALDKTALKNYLLKKATLPDLKVADLNGDGKVNVLDYSKLNKLVK